MFESIDLGRHLKFVQGVCVLWPMEMLGFFYSFSDKSDQNLCYLEINMKDWTIIKNNYFR